MAWLSKGVSIARCYCINSDIWCSLFCHRPSQTDDCVLSLLARKLFSVEALTSFLAAYPIRTACLGGLIRSSHGTTHTSLSAAVRWSGSGR